GRELLRGHQTLGIERRRGRGERERKCNRLQCRNARHGTPPLDVAGWAAATIEENRGRRKPVQVTGWRRCQSVARWNACPARRAVASSKGRATSCRPIGIPSAVKPALAQTVGNPR